VLATPDPAKASGQSNPCGGAVQPSDKCGTPQLPMTVFNLTGSDRGESMTANPLTKCGSPGSSPSVRLPGQNCIDAAPGKETNFWVRAHLLRGLGGGQPDLHGPGNRAANLIMTDKSLNLNMFRQVESTALQRVAQNEVLAYTVQAQHVADSGDRRFFADGMVMTLVRIDPLTGNILETIFTGTAVSTKPRPIPTNCT